MLSDNTIVSRGRALKIYSYLYGDDPEGMVTNMGIPAQIAHAMCDFAYHRYKKLSDAGVITVEKGAVLFAGQLREPDTRNKEERFWILARQFAEALPEDIVLKM